jgi:uncharacterized NAD(P)/FAD-binding protein YdhS
MALSRHGSLPQTHAQRPVSAPNCIAPSIMKATTTRALLRAVRSAAAEEERRGGDWRSVVDSLRPATPDVWNALGSSEQRRFLRHVRPFWETHRHRVPRSSAERITSLIESGRLVVEAGRIHHVRRAPGERVEIAIDIFRRGGRSLVRADALFDCTGPALRVADSSSELVRRMLEGGLAVVDPSGLGLHAEPTGEIIGKGGSRSAIFAVGPLLRGRTYEATAVPELRVQAERTATAIALWLERTSTETAPRAKARDLARTREAMNDARETGTGADGAEITLNV